MQNVHPCPPGPYKWWYSRNEEDDWQLGGFTPEDAFNEALGQEEYTELEPDEDHPYWRVGVYVCQARPYHMNLSKEFHADRWLEDKQDYWEENPETCSDEDGERGPLEHVTPELVASLEASVRLAIWHWQNRHGLALSSWALDFKGPTKFLTARHPEGDPI